MRVRVSGIKQDPSSSGTIWCQGAPLDGSFSETEIHISSILPAFWFRGAGVEGNILGRQGVWAIQRWPEGPIIQACSIITQPHDDPRDEDVLSLAPMSPEDCPSMLISKSLWSALVDQPDELSSPLTYVYMNPLSKTKTGCKIVVLRIHDQYTNIPSSLTVADEILVARRILLTAPPHEAPLLHTGVKINASFCRRQMGYDLIQVEPEFSVATPETIIRVEMNEPRVPSSPTPIPMWIDTVTRKCPGLEHYAAIIIKHLYAYLHRLISIRKTCVASGCLITGQSGVGKTLLARTIASSSGYPWRYVHASEFTQKSIQDTEVYFKSLCTTPEGKPLILVVDSIECIIGAGESRQQHGNLVHEYLRALIKENFHTTSSGLFIMGVLSSTTVESVDPDFLRSDRLSFIVPVSIHHWRQRLAIFRQKLHTCARMIDSQAWDTMLVQVSKFTHGATGADIENMCKLALLKLIQQNQSVDSVLRVETFKAIFSQMNISAKSEFYYATPDVNLDKDFFGNAAQINLVNESIISPLVNMEEFLEQGISPPRGLLIYGPSGTGKSMLAAGIMNALGFHTLAVSGSQLRSKVVGESEQNVARLFSEARALAPCVILIDQIDMLLTRRDLSSASATSEGTSDRIVTSFLTEMDGILTSHCLHDDGVVPFVFIIGITQHKELIDGAVLRPGRLDIHLRSDPPTSVHEVESIFHGYLSKMPHTLSECDISTLLSRLGLMLTRTHGSSVTGSDLEFLCREAAMCALRESVDAQACTMSHFLHVLDTPHFCGKLSGNVDD